MNLKTKVKEEKVNLEAQENNMQAELINWMGDDQMVANAARVSFNKDASNYSEEKNYKLLKFLAENGHWTPFAHPQLQFRITCPIYVERQLVKTEIGRIYNSISGRYVDFSDTYTKITEWRSQSKDSKQGSDKQLSTYKQKQCDVIQEEIVANCKKAYQELLDLGVAKEQARTILPLNLNTQQIWTGSLYTFIRLYKQRNDPHAQEEIRELVNMMLEDLKAKTNFNQTLEVHGI